MQLTTPVGRLVQGDCFEPQKTDKPKLIKSGPKAGQPVEEFFIALAIDKNNPEYAPFYEKLCSETRRLWPELFNDQGVCNRPNFAYKIIDGDSKIPNQNGKIPCERPGFPGHWILNCSTGFKPYIFERGGIHELTDKNAIKRGYFIRLEVAIRSNKYSQRPGIFMNPTKVEFVGYGEPLETKITGDVFGNAPTYIPNGMTDVPM